MGHAITELVGSSFHMFGNARHLEQHLLSCSGGPRVYLNIEDHNSFNAPHGPVFNTDLQVSPGLES